jgi:hypothetical protein
VRKDNIVSLSRADSYAASGALEIGREAKDPDVLAGRLATVEDGGGDVLGGLVSGSGLLAQDLDTALLVGDHTDGLNPMDWLVNMSQQPGWG